MAGVTLALGGHPVLTGIDMAVPAGSLVALVGASGAGKTSLLRLINRLVMPDSGRITLFGKDILAGDAMNVRRGIGYAVQGGGLFPHWTVEDNIAAVPWLLGWPKAKRLARAAELMVMLDLPSRMAQRFPGELSGGQASRVGLARALAARPRLLLLDEPFGALDEFTRERLNIELMRIVGEVGATTLFVTHNILEAIFLADEVMVMTPRPGRLARMVHVPFARPRTPELTLTPEFNALVAEVRDILGTH
jgi:ABC-type proline/glycine betaine transport system ATPase subunit